MKSLFVFFFTLTATFCSAQLSVTLAEIDDTGFAAVLNVNSLKYIESANDLSIQHRVDWDNGNGYGTKDLFDELPAEGGILVVGLWNRVFKGMWGGKYQYDIRIKSNGSNLYSKASGRVSDNSKGMKFFKVFLVEKTGNSVSLHDISSELPDVFYPLKKLFTAKFNGEGNRTINMAPLVEQLSNQ